MPCHATRIKLRLRLFGFVCSVCQMCLDVIFFGMKGKSAKEEDVGKCRPVLLFQQ